MRTALVGGVVIDGNGGPARPDCTVVIDDSKIVEVSRQREFGSEVTVVDMAGKTVMPGLIDSHTHPTGASMTEFDHPIPVMETIPQVLDYVRARAERLEDGAWIAVRQVFITRLKEQR